MHQQQQQQQAKRGVVGVKYGRRRKTVGEKQKQS
jgi:hypothetical protein